MVARLSKPKAYQFLGDLYQVLQHDNPLTDYMITKLSRYRGVREEYQLPEIPDLRSLRGSPHSARKAAFLESLQTFLKTPQAPQAPAGAQPAAGKQAEAEAAAAQKAAEKQEKLELQRQAERWAKFKAIFGNYSYTNDFELRTALEKAGFAMASIKDIYDVLAKGFEKFSNTHPHLSLGKLEFRNYREPVNLAFNPEVREYFADNAFDLNTLTRHNYDGLLVTGAQFNTYTGSMLHTLKHVWLPFQEKVAKRRYALVAQIMAFGPIQTQEVKRLVRLDNGEVRWEKKRVPKGYFDDPLAGHILLPPSGSDTFRFGRCTLFNPRIQLTNQRATTEAMVDTAQDQPGDLIILPFPRYELEHRPHPGLVAGDTFPKMIMTSMAVTEPNYLIDALGMPSARGTSAVKDHDYGAIAITFAEDGTPYPRELIDRDGTGTFHDVVRMPDGSLKIYKFSPTGVEFVGTRDCYSMVEPDWHTGYPTQPLRDAYYGAGGIIPTLKPRYAFAHDYVNMTSINPYRAMQMGRTMYDNWQRWRIIREKQGYPTDLDRYLDQEDVWISYLSNAEAEMHLCGAELVWRSRMAPDTQQVLVASNHPAWLKRELNRAGATDADPQNAHFLGKLRTELQEKMRTQTTNIANTVEGDAAWHYLRGWLAEHRKVFGLDLDQFRLLERKESWIGPEKAQKKFQFADHGDARFRKWGSTGKRKLHGMRSQHGDKHSGYSHRGNWGSGVMVEVQHYMEEPAISQSHNAILTFDKGQVMNVHVRPDGSYMV